MDILFLLVALVLVGLVGYMAYAKSQRDQRLFNTLYKPVDEHLLDDPTGFDASGYIAFEGETGFTTQPFEMAAGAYTLFRWFPETVEVKVELVNRDTDHKQSLLSASGEGETTFDVPSDGNYFILIQPAQDDHWEIEIRQQKHPASSG